MRSSKLRIFLIVIAVIAIGILLLVPTLHKAARVPSGYKAKVACSETYVAGRPFDNVASTNFDAISPAFDWVNLKNIPEKQTVQASFLSMGKVEAVYRPGIGCVLDVGDGIPQIEILDISQQSAAPYPVEINQNVQTALLKLFNDDENAAPIRTRGAVVVQDGKVVAEHYAPGFTAETRQQSWSVAKGFTQAIVGILVREDLISLEDTGLMEAWPDGDERNNISVNHLLQMASGLEFGEEYANPFSDVDQMLFNTSDMAAFAAGTPLIHKPGTQSVYSSGTTNIVSAIIKKRLTDAGRNYHTFPSSELFLPIGMNSAVFEVDASGTFIGSSYIYATLRDFARFGQLYLQDGLWDGRRILPEGWVDYTASPAPGSDGNYGSHWSLNIGGQSLPGLPEDVIFLGGNDGQLIIVIPSKNAVIVRFGVTRPPADVERDVHPLIRSVFEAL